MVRRALIIGALLGAITACGPQKAPPAAVVVVAFDAGDCDEAGLHDGTTANGTCAFDFGTVSSATGATQTFALQNRGNTTANVTATLTNGDPSFSLTSTTSTIAAGASGTIAVNVLPVTTSI